MQKQTTPTASGAVYLTSTVETIIENAKKIERIDQAWQLGIQNLLDGINGLTLLLETGEETNPACIVYAIKEIAGVISDRICLTEDPKHIENIRKAVKEYSQTEA